jgi:hypothetical protein
MITSLYYIAIFYFDRATGLLAAFFNAFVETITDLSSNMDR